EPAKKSVKVGPIERDMWSSGLRNLAIARLDAERIGFFSADIGDGMRVFDSNGNEIWASGRDVFDLGKTPAESDKEYEELVYVMQGAVGDLDGDGVSEYIVAKKNDGIRAFDQSGKELWFYADDFPSKPLDVFDLDGDGRNEVIIVGKAVLDGKGKLIRESAKSHLDKAYVFSERRDRVYDIAFADTDDGRLIYELENGEELFSAEAPLSYIKLSPAETVTTFSTPIPDGNPEDNMASAPGAYSSSHDSENVAFPRAKLVTLRKGEPKYLAVIASFIGIPRSNFYVYDSKGNLVYHELLPEDAETIAVLPAEGGPEAILIGGKDTIWKYSVN
ncbi:MAG TPA: hypothetical protein VJV05_11975, partial [Pyrinomonadaceae bacterium]|nr:hypothetical protein [Pyrinomonadaceae bacterium]